MLCLQASVGAIKEVVAEAVVGQLEPVKGQVSRRCVGGRAALKPRGVRRKKVKFSSHAGSWGMERAPYMKHSFDVYTD